MDPFKVYAQFGVGGLVILAVMVIAGILYRLEGRMKTVERDLGSSKHTCDRRRVDLAKIFDKLEWLEKKDIETDGRFHTIESKLQNIGEGNTRMETKIDKLVDYYIAQGRPL